MTSGKETTTPTTRPSGVAANMSRRDQIFMTCDELVRDGHRVTEAVVLSMVGGSASTIHRYVKEWKDLSALREKAPSVPTNFLESLNALFLTLADEAKQEAKAREKELTEEIESLEEEKGELEEELDRRGAKEAKLIDANRTFEQRVETLTTQVQELTSGQQEAEKIRATLEGQVRDLNEQIRQQEEAANLALETLRQQHQSEIERLETVYQRSENRLFQQIKSLEDGHKLQMQQAAEEFERQLTQVKEDAADRVASAQIAQRESAEDYKTVISDREKELRDVKSQHETEVEGYQVIASAFSEMFGEEIEDLLGDTKALRKAIREAKKRFYSSPESEEPKKT